MLGMLVVTGRVNENTEYKISDFLFVYIGAPIVNLDNWLADPIILEDSFIPDNVAIISICDPYNPKSDSWMHQFEHNNINVFNLNIDDFPSLYFSADK